jgi:adenylate cyclase
MRKFLAELRRRNVFKVATLYVVVAWALMQGADVMFPALNLPAWTVTLVAALVIVGFPVALMLAWAYELTSSGVARDRPGVDTDANTERSPTPQALEQPSTHYTPIATPAAAAKPAIDDRRRSLAVLPFADLSPGHDHEYFADGLTEELLNALARVAGLRVPSRTSCFAFRGQDIDVAAVAERLRVSHVLEGSVRRSGERVRITAKLVDTGTDSHLWAETYDRTLDDIFAIQGDIAHQIVGALELRLRPQDASDPTTTDAPAYELYLKGLGLLNRFGPKSLRSAMEAFRRATELDPRFAKAWAGLSAVHSAFAAYHSGGAAAIAASDEASRRAVALAPHVAEVHTARAVSFSAQQRYEEAAAEFDRAVELNPRSLDAWYQYGRMELHRGDLPRALELFEKAMQTDPEDYQSPFLVAPIHRKLGDEKKALEIERRGCALAQRHIESYPDNARAYFLAIVALYNIGERDKAFEWADKAVAIDPTDGNTRYNVACFYAQLGEADRAFEFLRGSIASRSWAENDPELDPIRGDPRFQEFLATLPA